MKVPDDQLIAKVTRWAEYAEDDLMLACHGLQMENAPYRLIAYHAQQCVEKYLKAYLVLQNVDFPYTHNIAALLELFFSQAGPDESLRSAEELTPYAISTRYPGEEDEVSPQEAVAAIETAEHARKVIRTILIRSGAGSLSSESPLPQEPFSS